MIRTTKFVTPHDDTTLHHLYRHVVVVSKKKIFHVGEGVVVRENKYTLWSSHRWFLNHYVNFFKCEYRDPWV